jgi:hypothetical protein
MRRRFNRERPTGESVGQRLALDELHDQKVHTVLVPNVIELADVRVREAGDRLGLPIEALAMFWSFREMRHQHLDRNRSVEARVARPVDLPHAAGTDCFLDLVRTQLCSGFDAHFSPRGDAAKLSQLTSLSGSLLQNSGKLCDRRES